ncbi:MAG: hypothetical protein U0800_13480 [Isosphaeraceae bacterium]
MSTPLMIEAEGLRKQFGSFLAVRDVSFRVPRGQVVAFLGAQRPARPPPCGS